MPKPKIDFTFFSSFIIRTPIYPIEFYKNLTEGFSIETDTVKKLVNDYQISEALYLASPELFSEIQKWCAQENYPIQKGEKIKISVLKYLIRMSTRCTPFGLFAACGAGRLADLTKINIKNISSVEKGSFYRRTRLDMQFLVNLSTELAQDQNIQNELLFYPNSTLYKLGDFYRYVEYIFEKKKRKYSLEALKKSSYLDLILEKAVLGKSKDSLAAYLISDEISQDEALEFIDELISNQILISELEPALTEISNSENLKSLSKKEAERTIKIETFNNEINDKLLKIDLASGNQISSYEAIMETLLKKEISFDKKYLFQTDLFLESNDFQLDKKHKYQLQKAIHLLNKISEKPKQTPLENFKKSFLERYEHEAVPLVKALDIETGIGYLQNTIFDSTPILDSIEIKSKTNTDYQINLNKAEKIIYSKLLSVLESNQASICLSDEDFKDISYAHKMPETFSCVFEIVQENGKEYIAIQSIGGSSAANLMARFCYGNSEINNFAKEIIQFESENINNKIIAEIIHLPESRTGNVLRRPNFRIYEIPYLGKSNLENSNQINIQDLWLFVKNDRLVLWSKKHDKEVITKLTNAHNYSHNALPIYHFLCDMQFENCKSAIGLNNKLEKLFDYLPRITIENCIISKAKWIFSKTKHVDFFNILASNNFNPELFRSALLSENIKENQYVSLIDGDNTLVINLANDTCLKMLAETVKNRPQFILEEFLFPSNNVVKGEKGCYANQFIVGLKNNKE
ncbi:lantibiotic dehydratase family protein [Flavobacterium sp. LHD-85]|uniref:lantibiotic dehydratase family protein n=1 Tax=Flavobacterium sp. LHD-85 TaxID=3071410 RepID=UPI0027E0C297|nr:lantibiotic dehydratase family protein [Flavobacterium sp. LHD-85]MDQ6531237.1 lantibiotic dehydratase family protein [Flavobacterium sp. LHD-85]